MSSSEYALPPRPKKARTQSEARAGEEAGTVRSLLDDLALKTIETDGLFVNIASYCEPKTLLKLCTTSKAVMERRSELAVTQALPADPRVNNIVHNCVVKRGGWSDALRFRVALELPLEFTFVHPKGRPVQRRGASDGVGGMSVKRISQNDFLDPCEKIGAICGGPHAMLHGIHRVVISVPESGIIECGVVLPSALKRYEHRIETGFRNPQYDLLEFSRSCTMDKRHVGLEFDSDRAILKAYYFFFPTLQDEENDIEVDVQNGKWQKADASFSYGSEIISKRAARNSSFCWAVEIEYGDEFMIQRRLEPFTLR